MITVSSLQKKLIHYISIIRFKPFDKSTLEGRSNERLRKVFWTALTSAFANGLNTLTVLVSVPLTLSYLGVERYGIWMTLSSIAAFLGYADLGIGNVLLNTVAEATGEDDIEKVRKNITSALFLLTLMAVAAALLFLGGYFFINWPIFFNVLSVPAQREAGPAVIVFIACFLVNLPLSIVPKIQGAYQEGYISGIWLAVTNLIGLIGVFIVAYFQAGLPWLIITITGTSVLGNVLNGIVLFNFQRPQLFPRIKDASFSIAKQMVGVGILFLILQITSAIIYSSDNIIIARILGAAEVTTYAVPAKLFSLIPMGLFMFLSPLWPAYREAIMRGDGNWAKKTLIKTVLITLVVCLAAATFLLVFGKVILDVWTKSKVSFSIWLMVALGIWTTIQAVSTALAVFLNAINKIKFEAVFAVLTATISFLLKISIAKSWGLIGIVWCNIVVGLLFMTIPYTIYLVKQSSSLK